MSLTIGLSKGNGSPKYQNYWGWLRSYDPYVNIIDLYESAALEDDLQTLDALILTGGGDIHPERYGHPELIDACVSVDLKRDELELTALAYAVENKLPVLGVCRGLQIINVYKNGTLVPHLPAKLGDDQYHSSLPEGDNTHSVDIEPGSILFKLTGVIDSEVNSSHHQGIDRLGEQLAVSAKSPDGLIEAIEWQEPEHSSFLVAIQWHPERMNPENPLSQNLLERFFLEAESARIFKTTIPPLPKEEPEELPLPDPDKDKGSDPMFPIIQ